MQQYTLNVSQRGQHLFRVVLEQSNYDEARATYRLLVSKFTTGEGFNVRVTRRDPYTGVNVEFDRAPTDDEIRRLLQLARDSIALRWGTARQIEAENGFFDLADQFLTEEQHDTLARISAKATTEERVDFAMKQLDIRFVKQGKKP